MVLCLGHLGSVGRSSEPNLFENSGISGNEVLADVVDWESGSPSDVITSGFSAILAAAANVDLCVVSAEVLRVEGLESGAVLATRSNDLC